MASELWEIPPGISRQMGALGNYLWFMPVCGVCLCQREKHCKYFLSHSQAHGSFAEGPKRSQTHLPRYFLQVFFLQFCSQSRKAPMEEVLQWMAAGCEEERPRRFSLEEAGIQATPHAMLWVIHDRPTCRGPFHHATDGDSSQSVPPPEPWLLICQVRGVILALPPCQCWEGGCSAESSRLSLVRKPTIVYAVQTSMCCYSLLFFLNTFKKIIQVLHVRY